MIIKFVLYSKATQGGGAVIKSTGGGGGTVKSTSSGGATTRSTSSGGGTSTSTQSGGGSSQTSSAGGVHRHQVGTVTDSTITRDSPLWNGNGIDDTVTRLRFGAGNAAGSYTYVNVPGVFGGTPFPMWTEGASDSHTHGVTVPAHSHSFSTPNHSHDVSIPSHTHEIDLPNHTHQIDIPSHTHDVEHKIVELDTLPTRVIIRVDGNTVPHTAISAERLNLIDYLNKDADGKVTRGRHEVTIQPNGLGRIEADLILRVFLQSHIGGAY